MTTLPAALNLHSSVLVLPSAHVAEKVGLGVALRSGPSDSSGLLLLSELTNAGTKLLYAVVTAPVDVAAMLICTWLVSCSRRREPDAADAIVSVTCSGATPDIEANPEATVSRKDACDVVLGLAENVSRKATDAVAPSELLLLEVEALPLAGTLEPAPPLLLLTVVPLLMRLLLLAGSTGTLP